MEQISDALCLLGYLFLGSQSALPCGDGTDLHPANLALLDWNRDDVLNLSDPVGALMWLFLGGPPHALGEECHRIEGCSQLCM